METKIFNLNELDYIQLNKLLKLLRLVNSGGEANMFIDQGKIYVNGVVETRRRKKLRKDDAVSFSGIIIHIK